MDIVINDITSDFTSFGDCKSHDGHDAAADATAQEATAIALDPSKSGEQGNDHNNGGNLDETGNEGVHVAVAAQVLGIKREAVVDHGNDQP